MNKLLLIAVVTMALAFFAGCGLKHPMPYQYSPKIPKALYLSPDLEKRLIQYWTLKSHGNLAETYAMEAPYIKAITPYPIYKKIFSSVSAMENMEILSVRAVSNLYYEITLRIFRAKKTNKLPGTIFIDRWVKANGIWNHVIKDPVFKNYFP